MSDITRYVAVARNTDLVVTLWDDGRAEIMLSPFCKAPARVTVAMALSADEWRALAVLATEAAGHVEAASERAAA